MVRENGIYRWKINGRVCDMFKVCVKFKLLKDFIENVCCYVFFLIIGL